MVLTIILTAWAVTSVAAFALLVSDWRRRSDVTRGDATFMALLSLTGPIGLAASAIVWVAGGDWGGHEIIWKRKAR